MGWLIALGVIGIFALIGIAIYGFYKRKKIKIKEKKEKIPKEKRVIKNKNKNGKIETKGSYCGTVEKFLYRKEIKIFVLINKILPHDFIAFPKISLKSILEPVGNHALFDSVKSKVVDIVVFEKETMKPRIVIDIFDGSIDDEGLEIFAPEILEALNSAKLPVVKFRVKTDYDVSEIETPILDALGIKKEEENKE